MMRRAVIEPGTLRRPQGEQGALPHTVNWSIPRLGMDSRKDGILEFSRERLHTLPSFRGRHDPAPRALLRRATPNANIQSQAKASSRSRYRGFRAGTRDAPHRAPRISPRPHFNRYPRASNGGAPRGREHSSAVGDCTIKMARGCRQRRAQHFWENQRWRAGLGTVRAAVRCVRQISSSGCAASM